MELFIVGFYKAGKPRCWHHPFSTQEEAEKWAEHLAVTSRYQTWVWVVPAGPQPKAND